MNDSEIQLPYRAMPKEREKMMNNRKGRLAALALAAPLSVSILGWPTGVAAANAATSEERAKTNAAVMCSNSWKRAGSVPFRWSTVEDRTCSIFGNPKYKAAYSWAAERGSLCVKVKGFKKAKAKWYNAGCGRRGTIKNVPWGNVAAHKAIRVKGAALFRWR